MNNQGGVEILEQNDTQTNLIPMYKVLVHDDNVNTMDHVVRVFQDVFKYELEKCIILMLEVHNTGISLVKVEPLEYAELHRDQLQSYGLTVSIEKD
jgi:ATP-dependent Clp protease adaptor protein ClpS